MNKGTSAFVLHDIITHCRFVDSVSFFEGISHRYLVKPSRCIQVGHEQAATPSMMLPSSDYRQTYEPQLSRKSSTAYSTDVDLQPWTAARCHRLLGQLQLRLASLRKLISETRAGHLRQLKRPSRSLSTELDGQPMRAAKRIRHTYRQRRQPPATSEAEGRAPNPTTPPRVVRALGTMKLGHSSPASGHVDFPSPVWRKIRNQPFTTPRPCPAGVPSARYIDATAAIPQHVLKEFQSLRSSAPDGHFRVYEQIFNWLSDLLMTTKPGLRDPHRKSLLAMCLSRMPACIQDIEAWDWKASEERATQPFQHSSVASLQLYGELEGFGLSSDGWRPLRLVVRAHAIALLTDAISEGLLTPAFVGVLARLCRHLGCAEEEAKLATSMQRTLPGPTGTRSGLDESRRLRPLCAMAEGINCSNTAGHAFESLTNLLRQRQLPIKWLSTRGFRGLWRTGLEALTAARPMPSVADFMSQAISCLALSNDTDQGTDVEDSGQTLLSIIAGVAAAARALNLRGSKGQEAVRRIQARRRLIYVLDRCVAQAGQRKGRSGGYDRSLFILVVARHLATGGSGVTARGQRQWDKELGELVKGDRAGAHLQYVHTILLASAIARCRDHAPGARGHDSVEEVCARLAETVLPGWCGQGLRADVAFLVAHKTKDVREIGYTESLPTATGTAFSGWRWEEGINEWVLPSPAAAKGASGRAVAKAHEDAATEIRSIDDGDDGNSGGVACQIRRLGADLRQPGVAWYASGVRKAAIASLTATASGRDGRGIVTTASSAGSSSRQRRYRVGIRPGGSAGKSGTRGPGTVTGRRLRASAKASASGRAALSQALVSGDDWDELAMAIG